VSICWATLYANYCVDSIHWVVVSRCCAAMRQCRPMMVRTERQYVFIYDVLFDALLTHYTVVGNDINAVYRQLSRVNSHTKLTYFQEQFTVCNHRFNNLMITH